MIYKFVSGNSDLKNSDQKEKAQPVPPGAPDRTPIEDPEKKRIPLSDPRPPEKKKPRL